MTSTAPAPTRARRSTLRRLLAVGVVLVGVVLFLAWLDRAFTETTTATRALGAQGVEAIVVDTRSGDVTVTTTDRDDVLVTSRATSGLFSSASPDVAHDGGELRAVADCAGVVVTCGVAFDVELPRDLAADVRIRGAAGEIDLVGLSGDVDVETAAGTIELSDFDGEVAHVRTVAGEIVVDATATTRALDLRSTAGSIRVSIDDREPLRVDATTTAGGTRVTVAQDPDADRVVVAETVAGAIEVTGR